MVHYPTHERESFLEWLESGCPDVAVIEENYKPREVSADELLRRFLLPAGCTDVLPKSACQSVAAWVGHDERETQGITYAIAASALLVQRAAGEDAAQKFLARLLDVESSAPTAGSDATSSEIDQMRAQDAQAAEFAEVAGRGISAKDRAAARSWLRRHGYEHLIESDPVTSS